MIFYKITVINGTFCTKRQTSCFDVADNTATAGIYGERLPDVGKHIHTSARRRRNPPSSDLKVPNNKTRNCRQKNACPLDGNCLQPSVIYQATVTRKDNNTTVTYIGLRV